MANGTTDPPAAATGRVTRSTAQAAAPASSATHDTAAYLTRDMLPERLSRFADYVTAVRARQTYHYQRTSTSLDIDNKLAYLYNYYVEHVFLGFLNLIVVVVVVAHVFGNDTVEFFCDLASRSFANVDAIDFKEVAHFLARAGTNSLSMREATLMPFRVGVNSAGNFKARVLKSNLSV
ncbi:hypothetical protein E4U32_005117 [Claviceps aff. humidiphila group G2b]|nr:hypothetical protein E4U32_005116 [Claviceps aff. humidiphila group G2b]KAG6057433.1 hypothetical protein E4U32_005117 [Claviceps aff. humidiphila group G2b]